MNRFVLSGGKPPGVAVLVLMLCVCQSAVASSPVNTPPSIAGAPATKAYVGKAYSFAPTASDPDGNTLTFKVSNKPAWATFKSATGRLTGTPSSAQVGKYSNIVISVSDGMATTALPAFAITVVQPVPTGSFTVSWVPPTENEDGTRLTALAGYRIYYGKVSGQYAYSVTVGSPSITSAKIESLEPAVWYVAVTAITSAGMQSDFSMEVSKAVL
jgi:hypothetical protein